MPIVPSPPSREPPALIHVADMATLALGLGTRPDPMVPELDPVAFATLGIQPGELALAADDLDEHLPPLVMAFLESGKR